MKAKIMEQLVRFRLNHSKPYSANDLELLMEDWFEALSDEQIDMIVFQKACSELKKTSRFFPTIDSVINKCKELIENVKRIEYKPDDPNPDEIPSPEQVAENIKRIKEICKQNASKYKPKY